METVPAPVLLKFMRTRPISRMRAEKAPVFLSVERFPVSASSMNHDPVPSVTLAAAYEVLPPASNPSLSGAIVAVVMEIVKTIRPAVNASSDLVTIDFFILFALSSVIGDNGVSRSIRAAYVFWVLYWEVGGRGVNDCFAVYITPRETWVV